MECYIPDTSDSNSLNLVRGNTGYNIFLTLTADVSGRSEDINTLAYNMIYKIIYRLKEIFVNDESKSRIDLNTDTLLVIKKSCKELADKRSEDRLKPGITQKFT
jgi:hypothetical protein